jgi:hypothetical protein
MDVQDEKRRIITVIMEMEKESRGLSIAIAVARLI